jgi:Phytanoyl-CoA dioxygenase (PhyH)
MSFADYFESIWLCPMLAIHWIYSISTNLIQRMSTTYSHDVSLPPLDRAAFLERGYLVVKGLFSPEEVRHLRTVVLDTAARYEKAGLMGIDAGSEGAIRSGAGDLLSVSSLRHVLLDPRVLGVARELLDGEPQYWGDSSFRVGKNGVRGWHRDNVNRRRWRGGPDWRDPYPLLRGGLYLQDQSHHSGGLALRPGSNRLGRVRPTLPKLVAARPGDFVVWHLRTVHSGEVVRMRVLPRLPLHPRLQTLLPPSMRLPEDGERIVLFMTFGCAGPHLDNYIAYLKSRDYMHVVWDGSRFDADVWGQAEQAGLRVFKPVPGYGAPPEHPA